MKNFANAAFAPDVILIVSAALEAAISTLPEPLHARHVDLIAESILRTAGAGEREQGAMTRIALMELQLHQR